ncbi:hypothetical protein BDW60DRAFT_212202 [Aspergillus nidulans var. acristatus]
MIITRLLTLFSRFLCAFSPVMNAYDLQKGKRTRKDLGLLGVALHYNMASRWPESVIGKKSSVTRNCVFSSHIASEGEIKKKLTPGQLKGQTLNAMSVLAWGNELILASSQKGKYSFAYEYAETKVLKSLLLCRVATDKGVSDR